MKRFLSNNVARSCLIAAGAGALGFVAATSNAADDAKSHPHKASMKEQMQMMKGAEGAAMMKDAMLMMAAHQHLLGEMTTDAEVQRVAKTPEMAKAIEEVKAAMKDHAARDKKKAEVAKDHREAMMVLAHALMKQDKELEQMLKEAEEGEAHHSE